MLCWEEDVCDRIGILYGGQLRALGSVNELLTRSEMTQIRSRKLSVEAIEKIQKIIQNEHAETIDVQNPRDRLEDYFLQIVSEAQAEKLQTSGAILGSGVSDFLTSRERRGRRAFFASFRGATKGVDDDIVHCPTDSGGGRASITARRINKHPDFVSIINVTVQSRALTPTRFRCLRFPAGSDYIFSL